MKKLVFAAAAAAAFAATAPAHATSSIACRGTINPQLRIDLVVGHLVGPAIAQVRLSNGSEAFATGANGVMLAQAWLDEHALHLDIVEANGQRYLARMRTWRRTGRGEFAGTLRFRDQQHQVRCRVED